MNKRVGYFILLILVAGMTSCKFSNVLKRGDVDQKYELATQLYAAKDYSRALQLYDQLMGVMRATDKTQKIYYNYAYCYFYQKEYTMASYYFKRYTSNFPNTPEAEECAYMSAYCNYMNSPEYALDQTSTYEAIKELQNFTNTYPTSPRVSECNDLIDKLREKLEMKDYKIARMYYRMEDYAAAIQCMNNILKEYAETPHKEEILYLIFQAEYKYASQSIDEKKKERFKKTLVAYNDLASQYPTSQYLQEAGLLKSKAQLELDMLQKGDKPNSFNKIKQ
jgi:outer membrane protein assembly factor BamD